MSPYVIAFIASAVAIIAAGVAGNRSSQYEKLAEGWSSAFEQGRRQHDKYLLKENTWQTVSGLFLLTAVALWISGIILFFVR